MSTNDAAKLAGMLVVELGGSLAGLLLFELGWSPRSAAIAGPPSSLACSWSLGGGHKVVRRRS